MTILEYNNEAIITCYRFCQIHTFIKMRKSNQMFPKKIVITQDQEYKKIIMNYYTFKIHLNSKLTCYTFKNCFIKKMFQLHIIY